MISRVSDDRYKAIKEFDVEELIPPHQHNDFSRYLNMMVESGAESFIVRFLMEEWKDGGVLLAYVWAIWKLDLDGEICDIEILLPENHDSLLAHPEDVENTIFFRSENPIYFNEGVPAE